MVFNWFKKRNKAQTTTPQEQENNAAITEQPVSSSEESPANDSPSETTTASSVVSEESTTVIVETASSEITAAFAAEEAPTNDTDETAPSEAAAPAVSEESTTVTAETTPSETTTVLAVDPISKTAAEHDNTPQPQAKPKSEGGYFARIRQGLAKTRHGFANLFLGKKTLDQDLIDDLEAQLLTADVGIEVTTKIIDTVTQQIDRKELKDVDAVKAAVRDHMQQLLAPFAQPLDTSSAKPYVILMTGINGAGKTTTIGKLARHFQQEGKKVMLAAGDTFRAAAVEQLQTWGARHNVPVIAQGTGADAASVAYDALQSATARGVDVLIIDTAGRLHTQDHLMAELQKIKRVIGKLNPDAPHETMLIIDAGNGQNALRQAEQFHKAMQLDSITVTKLDGTAKGGILFAISEKLGIPIRYIGVGEQPEDLRPFNANEFVRALLYAE